MCIRSFYDRREFVFKMRIYNDIHSSTYIMYIYIYYIGTRFIKLFPRPPPVYHGCVYMRKKGRLVLKCFIVFFFFAPPSSF